MKIHADEGQPSRDSGKMKKLLENAPPLNDPSRAAWNRRLDETLTGMARTVGADARQSAMEARRRGSRRAAAIAEGVARRACRIAVVGEG